MQEYVVLIDQNDQELGTMEKLEAHKKGVLHRAISVFIYNKKGEILLQQRSNLKYHSPLLWTNACCSHPKKNESYLEAAKRRVFEELNINTELKPIFNFIYKANVGNNLIEHELDHVFYGNYNDKINFNTIEVNAIRWIKIEDLIHEIKQNPESFTIWFKIILNQYLNKIKIK